MRLVICLCGVFRSLTCNYCSKVIIYVRCELTYVEHAVTPDDNNQYVCLTVKRRNLILSLIGVCISTPNRFDTARLGSILSETPGPWIITAYFNAHHSLWGIQKMDRRGRRLVFLFPSDRELHCANDGSPTFLLGLKYNSTKTH